MAIISWAGFWGVIFFALCKKLKILRVQRVDEILGLDIVDHYFIQEIDMKVAKDIVENIYH